MKIMKILIFCVADPYETKGWSILAVDEANIWQVEHHMEREDAFVLKEFELLSPTSSELVQIGLVKVEEMKEELIKQNVINTQRIKEFESKFLSLDAPEMDKGELS